ncbi:HD-domain/PDEase-like protein [Hesseltinella vesiculosa]|uniref:Phosphodiesterase n=1 Tax=Hesseltinella vesiculosa TaxID=101127 RepID=A0A1X2GGL3_9FUNG|nr:HD-domain/PDEase-like protein [Hesseltinella vesiculosa]
MLILRHNTLPPDDLFLIERMLLKARQDDEDSLKLNFTLSDKRRADIYGRVLQCFARLNLFEALGGISESNLLDFIIDVDKGYYPNAYHSFLHAVDVTFVLYYMIQDYGILDYLSSTDIALLLIAGLCHDIGHPGLNNNYQVNTQSEIACKYNNRSVLESHSCSIMIDLVNKHQLLRYFETEAVPCDLTFEQATMHLIQLVLATDMIFHYELQENMTTLLDIIQPPDQLPATTSPSSNPAARLRNVFSDLGKDSPLLYFLREQQKAQQQHHCSTSTSPLSDHHLHLANFSVVTTQPSSSAPAALRTSPKLTGPHLQHQASSSTRARPLSSISPASAHTLPPLPTTTTTTSSSSSSTSKLVFPIPVPNAATSSDDPCWKKQKTAHVSPPPASPLLLSQQHRLYLCQIILHAADISNPLRPWPLCYTWSERVCIEFFHQGDMERAQGLPLSPNMDRQKTNQLNVGLQFSDFVVSPFFEIFAALFPGADEMVKLLKSNRREWLKKLKQQASIRRPRPTPSKESLSADDTNPPPPPPPPSLMADDQQTDIDDGDMEEEEEEDDDIGDYGCIPAPLVPTGTHILNPTGRRVSVAAGMAVIPDGLEKRTIGTGPRRRVYWGVRSASYADILEPSYRRRGSKITLDELDKSRRKSEQATTITGSPLNTSPTSTTHPPL